MSNLSNNQGRAYEYIYLTSLQEEIRKYRPCEIEENSSFHAAKSAWQTLPCDKQMLYELSAKATFSTIFNMEPNIIEEDDDILRLYIQADYHGENADVRDIIIERRDIVWEIGFSLKHNHMAIKHSRIAKGIDFGEKWYGVKCSQVYWKEIEPIFAFLDQEKQKGTFFRDLPCKEEQVYVPLLKAFIREVKTQEKERKDIPRRLVEYLLSKYDFYKVISIDSKRITTIQSFNMYGTLNLSSKYNSPSIKVPMVNLPKNLLHVDFKPKSKTTILMTFDNGWQFSFRIHNANKYVESSLKFDIQIIGIPASVNVKYNCNW